MITVSSNITNQSLTITSDVGKAVIYATDPITLGELNIGLLPTVTVTDPGLSQRITDLEN